MKMIVKSRSREGKSSKGICADDDRMNLAQSLRSMDHSRYLLLATEMYTTLLSRLHLVERIGSALSQMLERDQ